MATTTPPPSEDRETSHEATNDCENAADPPLQTAAPGTLVRRIERETKRTVVLATALSNEELARTCNPQGASPLYNTLPQELRDVVFAFATAEYADPARMYDPTDYWYRPGHTGRLCTSTTLLLTCRRAWLEAHALPMQQKENAFWFPRGPYDVHSDQSRRRNVQGEHRRYENWLSALSKKALRDVRKVRLFTRMFQVSKLQKFLPAEKLAQGFRPRVFQITIRHSDWTHWEYAAELAFDDKLVKRLLSTPELLGVAEFKLELETLESQKDELEVIVQRLLRLEGKAWLPSNDCRTALTFVYKSPPVDNTWTGPTNINRRHLAIFEGMRELCYISKTITWTNTRFPTPERGHHPINPTFAEDVLHSDYYFARISTGISPPILAWTPPPRRWWVAMSLLEKQNLVGMRSVQQAEWYGEQMREKFDRAIAQNEAKRWTERWAAEGSLLRFVDCAA